MEGLQFAKTKRLIERTLRKAGCSSQMAKQIVSSGYPGYRESLSPEELEELGLVEKAELPKLPKSVADPVADLLRRTETLH